MDWTELFGIATGGPCAWLTVRRSPWNLPVEAANIVFQGPPAVVVRERSVLS